MLCDSCRSLRPELRRHPRGALAAAVARTPLRALVCARCGGAAPSAGPAGPAETRSRLERAGLAIAGPLLRACPPHAA